jgi:NAD(P)-dependent dehydrogenase (short-subunit alcohol dehydrogenase family)
MPPSIWFSTGAGRGMGVDIAKAALAAGYRVVATGRDTGKVSLALGKSPDLLVPRLDVTSSADAEASVKVAVEPFGRVNVLVNNAATFSAGFFEELTPEQMSGSYRQAPHRPYERHPCRSARYAQTAFGTNYLDLVKRRTRRLCIRYSIRRVEVRPRSVDAVAPG